MYCSLECNYKDPTHPGREALKAKFKHRITNVDVDNLTGDCGYCGRVDVRLRSDNGTYRCRVAERVRNRRYQFGISEEEQLSLLQRQNNRCDICKVSFIEVREHLDHCHTTGAVRGFLCGQCNTGIGLLKDSIDNLKSAIKYLSNVEYG